MKTVTQVDDGQLELPLGDWVDVDHPAGATHQERFEAFHAANRWVFYSLVMLTEDWVARGNTRMSVDMLVHVLRYQYGRQTRGDSRFKLNNNMTSRYARKLIEHNPDWATVFYTRELKTP